MTINIDPSVLIGYYNSKEGILTSSTGGGTTSSTGTTSAANAKPAPTPPWQVKSAPTASALATQVLAGQSIINPNAAQLDVPGETASYQSLFAIYQGLNALSGLTSDILTAGVGTSAASKAAQAFTTGVGQVSTYIDGLSLPNIRVTTGSVQSSDATTAAPKTQSTTYTTPVIFDGGLNDPVPSLQGNVQFNINITSYTGAKSTVPIDLSQLGSTPRTIPNVVSFINSQLQAAGAQTRFATSVQPGVPQVITVGSQKVTLPAGPDQWSLKVVGDSEETVSFSAAATAPAVYVGQTAGNVTAYNAQTTAATAAQSLASQTHSTSTLPTSTTVSAPVQQIVSLQANPPTGSTAPPAAVSLPGTTNPSPDEISANTLSANVSSVAATATGADGSLYVLANVTGTVDGETPQSSQGVALQKYDSAGNLIYSTILGSAGSVTGASIAVAADGSVAIAGSVTGTLDPANPSSGGSGPDSFVALYSAQGNQQWADTSPSPLNNQANSVAFGTNDTVYVAGQKNVSTATSTSVGTPSGYLSGYSSKGVAQFTIATGISGPNSLAVDGSTVVVAGANGGDAVVNSYTAAATGAPTLTATRDLGALGSGSVAGVAINNGQVVVAGTTTNSALNAGTVTAAFTGARDAFVAQLNENLAPSASDSVAYYGGTGSTTATALTVSSGQVYIAGTSTGGLPGVTNSSGTQEGFVAAIDPTTGQVGWSQALAGQDGVDAPQTLAVASSGASVLNLLGLPTQTLNTSTSQILTTATTVAAGDQFSIRTQPGATPTTVTISATDTPATLATKIQAASGYRVNVSVVPSGGEEQVKITPEFPGETIELLPGPNGKDALGPLGLKAGIIQTAPAIPIKPKVIPGVTNTSSQTSNTKTIDTYGLGIAQDFNLTTTAGVQAAQKAIKVALTLVQTAYTNLSTAGQASSNTPAITGTVPAYLQSELANYSAGLSRLTGNSSSGSSSSSSSSSLGSSLASTLLA